MGEIKTFSWRTIKELTGLREIKTGEKMITGQWLDAKIIIVIDNILTPEVDLGRPYETMLVHIPELTSADLTCYVAEKTGGTFYALGKDVTVAAGTGEFADIWEIGGHQFVKIGTSVAQTANRNFRICGVRS